MVSKMRMSTLTQSPARNARAFRSAVLVAMIVLAGCGAGGGSLASAGVPAPTPTPPPTTWSNIKRGGEGSVTGLAFHPTSANVLYARTDIGGAYRWDPITMSWTPIAGGIGASAAQSRFRGIESILLDPNNDQPIYIATGKYTFVANGRIFASSDRGATWTHLDLPFPLGGNNPGRAMDGRPMVEPHLPSTLFHGPRTAGPGSS